MGGVCAQISQRLDGPFHILVTALHRSPPSPPAAHKRNQFLQDPHPLHPSQ